MNRAFAPTSIDLTAFQDALTEAQKLTARQTEALLTSTTQSMNVFQAIYSQWVRRRVEDIEIGIEKARQLSQIRDPGQATQICNAWATENAQRLQEEMTSLFQQISALNQQGLGLLENAALTAAAAADKGVVGAEKGSTADPQAVAAARRAA